MLVEDNVLISDLLAMALKRKFKPAKLSVFSRARPALEHCRTDNPDIVIVDIGLPDMDGRAMIRALHTVSPDSRVIVLTGNVHPALPGELFALGVAGYVDKTSPLENTETAILRVLEGGIHFSAGPASMSAECDTGAEEAADPTPESLTERERKIAGLVAGGLISKEIAKQLGLSPRTVEKCRAQIQAKLKLRDIPSLVRWCVKHGVT